MTVFLEIKIKIMIDHIFFIYRKMWLFGGTSSLENYRNSFHNIPKFDKAYNAMKIPYDVIKKGIEVTKEVI